jgi:hypothetical protein
MSDRFLASVIDWWAGVSPEFAFLLALPFAVAALGLLSEAVRTRT